MLKDTLQSVIINNLTIQSLTDVEINYGTYHVVS